MYAHFRTWLTIVSTDCIQGYNTHVGDGGIKLSGGQRQRLAIARSIVKKPEILILDEATSAIDVRSEQIVQAALDQVSQSRTTITIAHRLSTIKNADTIIVLHKGRAIETGSHETLLENRKGLYYSLVHSQQLSLGDSTDIGDDGTADDDIRRTSSHRTTTDGSFTEENCKSSDQKPRNIVDSYGRLLYEKRSRRLLCGLTILFAMCGSGTA